MLLTSTTLNDQAFIELLSKTIEMKSNERKFLQGDRYVELTKKQVEDRVSQQALQEIVASGNRNRALEDASKYKLKMLALHDEIVQAAKGAFRNAGLIQPTDSLIMSGNGYYPQNTYMGWHTNACTAGVRIYCNWASEACQSGLHYWYEGSGLPVRTAWDDKGWNFRMFSTDEELPFWHAVFSYAERISVGFRVIPELEEKVIEGTE